MDERIRLDSAIRNKSHFKDIKEQVQKKKKIFITKAEGQEGE